MTLQKRLLFFLIAALFAVTSCKGSKPPAEDVTDNARALALIDQRNYNDAIVLLSQRLQIAPHDGEARILMASALAARNGIVLSHFIGIAQSLAKKSKKRPDPTAHKYEKINWQIKLAQQAFKDIPKLDLQSYGDITTAIQTLQVDSPSPGLYVFRAILKLLAFKYEVSHPYKLQVNSNCTVDLNPLYMWFNVISENLQSVVADLAAGIQNKKTREDLAKLQGKLYEAHLDVEKEFAKLDLSKPVTIPKSVGQFYSICE